MKKLSLFIVVAFSLLPQQLLANDQQLEDFVEARLLEINNDNEKALRNYNILYKKQSDSDVLADRLFDIALQEGDVKVALNAAKGIESRGSLPVQAHILRYSYAIKNNDWTRAERSLIGLRDDPVFAFMMPIMQSWIETARGNDGTILLNSDENSGLTRFYASDQIIYQYLEQKRWTDVRKSIVSVRPFNEIFARELILKAAPILYKNGQDGFARALLNAQGIGVARSLLGSLDDGDIKLKHIYNISPEIGLARLYGRVASTLVDQKLYDVSLFFARIAQWLAPNDPSTKLYLANSLGANGQQRTASELLSNINEDDPYFSLFSTQNIRLLLDNDRHDEAVQTAVKASDTAPKSQALQLLLAQTYDGVEQYDDAAKTYEKLIKDVSEEQKLRKSYYILYLARSLVSANKWKKAKIFLENGLKLKAGNPFLLNYYGYTLLDSGEDIERGFDLVKQAYNLEPSSPDITDSLGWGYYLQNDLEKAIPLLEKAAEVSKTDSEIIEHLGDAYWQAGRFIDARYIWRKASLIAEKDNVDKLNHKTEYGLDVPFVTS